MRCALYTRVSRADGRQTAENQLRELRQYADACGWPVTREFTNSESGRRGRAERAGLDAMLKAAARREFDVLVVWSLDRLTCEGTCATIGYLQRLEAHGVHFHSFTEEYLSSENELVRDVLLTVLAYVAQWEARRISERTKAGQETARRKGKRIGRPAKVDVVARLVRDLRGQYTPGGTLLTVEELYRGVNARLAKPVSKRTIYRALARLDSVAAAAAEAQV